MNEVLVNIVGSIVVILLLGAIVMLLVMVTQAMFAVRLRALRKSLAKLLFVEREHAIDENLTKDALQAYCHGDAKRLIEACYPGGVTLRERLGRVFGRTIGTLDREVLSESMRELFPDLRRRANAIANELGNQARHIKARLNRGRHAITVFWALVLALTWYLYPALLWPAPGHDSAFANLPLLQGLLPTTMNANGSSQFAAVGLSTIVFALAAGVLYKVFEDRSALVGRTALDEHPDDSKEALPMVGRDGCAVRVINFAGGGFDSIMQLGVTHALMVIQGRAPDAVVGLSTGAIPAAALAEVLQAGESVEAGYAHQPWEKLKSKEKLTLQTETMRARVHRFRHFVKAAFQARERLFDALTPDAYQVESNEPLVPLRTPFFQTADRQHKIESLSTRSGLIRLYNDVLALNIPFGTLVRILRRVLGFLAAGDVRKRYIRWGIRLLEFNRIWLLIGSNIRGVARLVPVLVRPLWKRAANVQPMSAGSLIFRFPINKVLVPSILNAAILVILLAFWIGGSLLPLVPVLFMFSEALWDKPAAWLGLIVYVVVLFFGFLATYRFDAASLYGAVRDNQRGVVQFCWLLLKLSATLIFLLGAAILAVRIVQFLASGTTVTAFDPVALGDRILQVTGSAIVVGAILFAVLFVGIGVGFLFTRISARVRKVRNPFSLGRWYLRRFLCSYSLEKSLFHTYDLRSFLTELFDKEYYGKTDINEVVSDSLREQYKRSADLPARRKKVSDYRDDSHYSPVHVGIAAANVLNGNLETIPEDQAVVDSIEAAMAKAPIYPARSIGGAVYVNGSNVANVPTRATTSFLRNRINPRSGVVHLYSVSPFPMSKPRLPDDKNGKEPYVHLWDIVKRALRLQRHRDAQLEQKLTQFYTQVIPERGANRELQNQIRIQRDKGPGSFARVWVTPIESDKPLDVNRKIMLASKNQQRDVVAQTIADGCRASLEIMIRPSIRKIHENDFVKCRRAVEKHLESQEHNVKLGARVRSLTLPGSDTTFGPGLREICERCAVNRAAKKKAARRQGHLKLNNSIKEERPAWPHERSLTDGVLKDPPSVRQSVEARDEELADQYGHLGNWPQARPAGHAAAGGQSAATRSGEERATISLLFSGGVFRGVFQMGVLNALNELRIQPDLIAGASIGSITAAMVARVFSMPGHTTRDGTEPECPERQRQIARLSAVYLAVDRLIQTDRFADFVRNLTIRASEVDFTLREADHFFRKYDHPRSSKFDELARKVVAGLERLFYVNPYQLNALVKALRSENDGRSVKYLRQYTQQWLRRMGVGIETLGAEPLRQLIESFVIPEDYKGDRQRVPFSIFAANSMQFLATATNLQDGNLEIIGDPRTTLEQGGIEELLMEALLVSSAFPGVFRPRWSWDLRPGTSTRAQYIDGGVLDNFPIEPVFDFLNGARAAGRITRRPVNADGSAAPHLMFAASLEAETPRLRYRDQLNELEDYWPSLLARTRELKYNTKADIYRKAENNIRRIYETATKDLGEGDDDLRPLIEPLDVEIVTVKPKWLCGTFGFHPMLGFRREKQARNIAHGCAATLLRFANVDRSYLQGWDIDDKLLPVSKTFDEAHTAARKSGADKNDCWLRPGRPCPYSARSLNNLNRELRGEGKEGVIDAHTVEELASIHTYCRQRKTHKPD